MAQIILDSNSNLIQGDFDSATVNNRTKLQTSTTNATTGVYVVPNGSATSASVQIANAADPTNASKVVVATNGSTDTQIVSGANGSGTYLPLSFYTNNDIRFQMGNAGELNVRTAPGTVSSGTSGQFLTSGGPGAGVSWTTVPPGGQFQTEVFTTPGTWTKPASATQVRVTVIGGGGGTMPGANPAIAPSGGTSSFGPAVSATGGAGGKGPATVGAPGIGTVSVGTTLRTTNVSNTNHWLTEGVSQGGGATSGITYSISGVFGAGRTGSTPVLGGYGGFASAIVPVSAPVAVTIGAGGTGGGSPAPSTSGGVGGVVVVEFVG